MYKNYIVQFVYKSLILKKKKKMSLYENLVWIKQLRFFDSSWQKRKKKKKIVPVSFLTADQRKNVERKSFKQKDFVAFPLFFFLYQTTYWFTEYFICGMVKVN